MFSSATAKASGENRDSGDARSSMDLSLRMDYYESDFVEDGSFLVLNTDGMSLSPSTPPTDKSDDEGEKLPKVRNEGEEDETPFSSINNNTTSVIAQEPQVLGEDPESSVDSSHSNSIQQGKENGDLNSCPRDAVVQSSMTNMSVASVSSASTDSHLNESSEELNLLMAENKKLTELLADSNDKMKQCITTTEKLKADHEEYKKKSDASREIIIQLRQENELLKAKVSMIESQMLVKEKDETSSLDRELACKQESLQRQSQTISELNERLNTVLTYNGKLNDELLASQKTNEELRTELEKIYGEKDVAVKQMGTMKEEIDAGRKTVAKFNEHQRKVEAELGNAKANISTLEAIVEEKTKLTDSLRRNMEDTVTALERRNEKLNQKEQEISFLTTKLAALSAETEYAGSDRLQALELQCENYRAELEVVREERAKLAAEKDALLGELNARNQELKEVTEAYEDYRRQNGPDFPQRGEARRNDNSADNANESLPSPLTSLPSVAGQLVGFVRRELLGWEDLSDANLGTSGGAAASETVVQQPKQEAIPPCPLCRKTFSSLERLQTHASNCGIENDDGQPDDPFVFP